ncbi:MAG: aminopeptidase P family protein, partial [Rhizobiales bacterium]|nr:aminopeptidase P family protein [Hyphomicrobiales bacterium]
MECPNFFWPWFSEDEYRRRYALVRAAMEQAGFECLVVYGISRGMGMEPGQTNLVYLTSVASWSQTYLVFPLHEDPTMFVTTANHVKNIRDNSVIKDVRSGGSPTATGGRGGTAEAVAERLKQLGVENKRIGIVGDTSWLNINLPYESHMTLTEALPEAEFEVVTRWYEDLRMVKSEEELERMRKSAAITDAVYDVMVNATRPGVRPCDLYNVSCRTALEMGGRLTLNHVGRTPMKNPDMDYPHYYPLTTPIEMGDVIMTEVAAGIGGYYGKIWGTFFIGDPTPEYEKMFALSASTGRNLHAALKAGVRAGDLKSVCQDDILSAGYVPKCAITGWATWNEPPDIRCHGESMTDEDYVIPENICVSTTG